MKKIVLLSALLLLSVIGFSQYATNGYYGGNPGGTGQNGYYVNNLGPPIMHPQDFQNAKASVDRLNFESERLTVAKQIVSRNLLSSAQVLDLMGSFSFESSRIDFAQAAYLRVADPQNYYVVNDGFQFSSSIRELDGFIMANPMSGQVVQTYSNGGMNGGGGGPRGGGPRGNGPQGNGPQGNGPQGNGPRGNGPQGHGPQGGYSAQGCGNGVSYSGGVNVVPVMPMCGMCHGHHEPMNMCEMEFGSIVNAINARCFESDKMMVARQALSHRMMSANQVRRVMCLFTFESSKLEFAKFAYHHTFDPFNYYVVNDAFTFSSSIRELDQFIRNC